MHRKFTEAQVLAVGGLSENDYDLPQIDTCMKLAGEIIPAFKESKSIKEWWRATRKACRELREANSETALGFLLRKGIQSAAMDWYNVDTPTYTKWARTESSNGVAEWYAPLYNTTIPGPIERGGRFPEVAITGEDSSIRNIVFGQVLAIDRTLFDDDQTGQVKGYSRKLGDGMRILESVWADYRFLGAAKTVFGVDVPVSSYTTLDTLGNTVTGPWSTALYGVASGNRPSTYAPLNLGRLAYAYIQSLNACDPLGNRIVTNPNRLVTSNFDALNGDILLKPGSWPAVVGPSNIGTQGSVPVLGGVKSFTVGGGSDMGVPAGFPGGFGSANPFGGMGIEHVTERYMPDWVWALGEAGKGFINQERDPMEVIEEAKNAGSYFEFDSIRYRSRKRFNMDWIGGGSRFWFLGNDGTVTGQL